jgi:hypothetical protein
MAYIRDLYGKIEKDIGRSGRAVLNVMERKPFSYTIGNAIKGLPELLVIGLSPIDATYMLNVWSDAMINRGSAFADRETVDVGGSFPCLAVTCVEGVRDVYTIQAGEYLERQDYDVVQMIVPDPDGRFPTDPLCAPVYRDVPILGAARVLQ